MKMPCRHRAIDKLFKRRDRIEMPDIQRGEVWDSKKKQLLIDTIFKGWHLPKFYFRKTDDDNYECYDGQQRLAAIFGFFSGDFPIPQSGPPKLRGLTYKQLPEWAADHFDDYEVDVEEISEATDQELEDLFLRLQLGTPLNTAEKLNAIGGAMKLYCKKVAGHSFFVSKVANKNSRYAHFEIAARWVMIESRGVPNKTRLEQIAEFLKSGRDLPVIKTLIAKRINTALQYLNEAFTDKAMGLTSKANVLSICMLASKVVLLNLQQNTAKKFGAFVEKFLSDLAVEVQKGAQSAESELFAYQQAISSAPAEGPSISKRIAILAKRLAEFDSVFSPLLEDKDVEKRATQELNILAENVINKVHQMNERYAAKQGEDLFKPTNKTMMAKTKFSALCRDENAMTSFIDNLYFLFYEGSGDAKRLPDPPDIFVMDVKFLRNLVRHDLDHGSQAEAGKKRRRAASVLEKYSGRKSFGECSPEDMLATQLKLLKSASVFLDRLT